MLDEVGKVLVVLVLELTMVVGAQGLTLVSVSFDCS